MQHETATIRTGMVIGVDAVPVVIEATVRDAGDGTPRILGLVDTCVREAYHRVLQAFHALQLPSPRGVTTVNFTPAWLRKHGSGFDLPLALALAGAGGLLGRARGDGLWAHGEVSLAGRVLPVRGAVSVAMAAASCGARGLLVAAEDAPACAAVPDLCVHAVETLADAMLFLCGKRELQRAQRREPPPAQPPPDLADIRGHDTPKRALAVAAAGRHNLLFVGPPGSGKTALLRRLPGLLPPPSPTEQLTILMVQAAHGAGAPPAGRPLRAPHHTSSTASLVGGGPDVRPGEVTLAHGGVLFLDELPEFRRDALEALREPLEEGRVVVARARHTVTLPADFLLVAAMNPCPCGYHGHPRRPCTCALPAVQRYRGRISGPLLDRIDLQVEVPALDPSIYRGIPATGGDSTTWRQRVGTAFERQRRRNRLPCGDWLANGRLQDGLLERCCALDTGAEDALEQLLRDGNLSGRARVRLRRIMRTLADLDDRERVTATDAFLAASLRGYARGRGS